MAERLARLGINWEDELLRQRQDLSLARYARHVHERTDLKSRLILDARDGYEQLLRGDSREAARLLQGVKDALSERRELLGSHFYFLVRGYLAVAYLRMGEQDNCVAHHGSDSCLLPIRGSGVHVVKDGSRGAVRQFLEILGENPGDITARWLLNLAYMTLGEYPDAVPPRWLIPPEVFRSEGESGRFRDVAPELGVHVTGLAGGSVLEDFDGDGDIDLMASSYGLDPQRDQLRFFRNEGDGRFVERTHEAGLTGLVGGLNLVQADYDNDGHTDVLVLRGGWLQGPIGQQPPSLLRNRGGGVFVDVTEEAGLLYEHPTQAAAWGDYDNDGDLDLFVGLESSSVPTFEVPLYQPFVVSPKAPCKLFRNEGDGTFRDLAGDAGLAIVGYVKGAAWGDYDNDGRLDIHVTQVYGTSTLYHNEGPGPQGRWRFTPARETEPRRAYTTWFWDYDNDGWLDLFVAGYSPIGASYSAGQVAADYLGLPHTAELPRLYRNTADGRFEDVTRQVRLDRVMFATGANFGDLDNDGWPDLYVATGAPDYRALVPNRMFRSDGGRRFQDVTSAAGVGHLQKGGAVSFGDLDNDGDQDIYLVVGGEYPGDAFQNALFLNPGTHGRWLTLRLEGTRSNRSAIGARIRVRLDSDAEPREVHAVVGSGGSYGASTLQQELGLGQARAIQAVEIRWPGGGLEVFSDVPLDRIVRLREGAGRAEIVEARPIPLAQGGAATESR